jgi:hypothetical protein
MKINGINYNSLNLINAKNNLSHTKSMFNLSELSKTQEVQNINIPKKINYRPNSKKEFSYLAKNSIDSLKSIQMLYLEEDFSSIKTVLDNINNTLDKIKNSIIEDEKAQEILQELTIRLEIEKNKLNF